MNATPNKKYEDLMEESRDRNMFGFTLVAWDPASSLETLSNLFEASKPRPSSTFVTIAKNPDTIEQQRPV